jgi:beta-phosphoglucomutase-like phosphatase (HAD superfamily)
VNISALLRTAIGPDWAQYFVVVEDASTAPIKKPHPQVYMQTLARLNVRAADCVAFEDSGNGLKAALAAGLPTIITPNSFTEHHNFTGALRVLPSVLDVTVARLREWHGR